MKTKNSDQLDISIILTAHKEGLFLHKTLLSVEKAIKKLDPKTSYEIILNLDNADQTTKKIAEKWQSESTKVHYVSFGNPSDNRNDGIKKSLGKFIALLDGDDLISENWLSFAYEMIKQETSPVVLRPEAHIQFGYNDHDLAVWKMRDSSDKQTDAIQMAYWNLWTNCIFASCQTLLETPYKNPRPGFGFEDYLFCTELIEKGIANKIVPQTILFYRRRDNSTSSLHVDTILDYSPLFDINYFKSLPLPTENVEKSSNKIKAKLRHNFKRAYRFAFDAAKKIGPINRLVSPIVREILYQKKLKNQVPDWLIDQLKSINQIENQIWPTKGVIAKMQFHPLSFDPFENRFGKIYHKLCHSIKDDHIDYLFLAPAMSGRGGTEKLIANYIKAIHKNHPEWRIGILSTQPFNELTIDYFKNLDVDMLDFGKLTQNVGNYEKDIIWSRILTQAKIKNLHIVNDEYWYRWVAKHKKLFQNSDCKINISLFMREFTHEKDRILSFSDPHLLEIWEVVNKVFTDNQKVITEALSNNAFDEEKLIVHYQPEDTNDMISPKKINPKKPLKILWASRISFQKRPDILKAVAARLDDNFIIDAYGIIEKKQFSPKFFKGTNINYNGGFNGIKSIKTSDYDVYLYTSQTDGIPNILIEIAKSGLPIISSNVGGIHELIKDRYNGLLIDIEDIDGYVEAIKFMLNNPEKAQIMAKNSQQKLKDQHSWEKFINQVKRDI